MSGSANDFLVVIPARFASSRFPGKALADLGGKAVVQRCYEQCLKAVPAAQIVVATEDQRIVDFCVANNINVVMTSDQCITGTDRVAEVALNYMRLGTSMCKATNHFLILEASRK